MVELIVVLVFLAALPYPHQSPSFHFHCSDHQHDCLDGHCQQASHIPHTVSIFIIYGVLQKTDLINISVTTRNFEIKVSTAVQSTLIHIACSFCAWFSSLLILFMFSLTMLAILHLSFSTKTSTEMLQKMCELKSDQQINYHQNTEVVWYHELQSTLKIWND